MFLITIAILFAISFWAIFAARFNSVPLSAAIFLVVTCVFPAEFFSFDAGGLTWTLDRFWFVILLGQSIYDYRRGRMHIPTLRWMDITLGLFVVWLMARTFTQPMAPQVEGQPSTFMHLLNGYLIPSVIYGLIRCYRFDPAKVVEIGWLIVAFGGYLGLTAMAEVTGNWSFVWPAFIGDPDIGIHFGRARGPMLQSVRLGICLNFALAFVWFMPQLLPQSNRWRWWLPVCCTPLFMAAIFATYTRSIWMGAGVVTIGLLFALLKGRTRRVAIGGLLFAGLMGAVVVGPSLIAFKREYSAEETKESTYMRAAFAYVSIQMFKDKPLMGFGFNQFQVYNLPYLEDRSTEIRLDSIRGYVHHNSFLSILVDLGLIGAVLYTLMVFARFQVLVEVWRHPKANQATAAVTGLSLCVIGVHAIQMVFHEVSFSTIENVALCLSIGLSQAAYDSICFRPTSERRQNRTAVDALEQPTQQPVVSRSTMLHRDR